MSYTYKEFLSTPSRKQWERIGLNRRAGVAVPLFSVYSQNSIGIGEFTDLIFLIDWCRLAGMSIIQLLPMNDTGSDFRPYDAQSTFALEPMYLAIPGLKAVDLNPFKEKIAKLREEFPAGAGKVNYKIKEAKLSLLWEIFRAGSFIRSSEYPAYFERYVEENKFWLDDYAIFKVIKENNQENKYWQYEVNGVQPQIGAEGESRPQEAGRERQPHRLDRTLIRTHTQSLSIQTARHVADVVTDEFVRTQKDRVLPQIHGQTQTLLPRPRGLGEVLHGCRYPLVEHVLLELLPVVVAPEHDVFHEGVQIALRQRR